MFEQTVTGAPLIERPELAARVRGGVERGSVGLVAGAGYGKTVLVEQALEGRTAAWLSCRSRDLEVDRLLVDALQAIRRAVPGAADVLLESVGAGGAPLSPIGLTRAMLDELEALLVEPLVFVLDDAEQLADARPVLDLLEQLLETEQDRLRIVICTRRPLDLRVARAQATGRVSLITESDLAFSAEETAALLAMQLGRTPTDDEVTDTMQATLGWPLGVALGATVGNPNGGIARFLAEEVLAGLDQELRAAMLASSAVEEITPAMAERWSCPPTWPSGWGAWACCCDRSPGAPTRSPTTRCCATTCARCGRARPTRPRAPPCCRAPPRSCATRAAPPRRSTRGWPPASPSRRWTRSSQQAVGLVRTSPRGVQRVALAAAARRRRRPARRRGGRAPGRDARAATRTRSRCCAVPPARCRPRAPTVRPASPPRACTGWAASTRGSSCWPRWSAPTPRRCRGGPRCWAAAGGWTRPPSAWPASSACPTRRWPPACARWASSTSRCPTAATTRSSSCCAAAWRASSDDARAVHRPEYLAGFVAFALADSGRPDEAVALDRHPARRGRPFGPAVVHHRRDARAARLAAGDGRPRGRGRARAGRDPRASRRPTDGRPGSPSRRWPPACWPAASAPPRRRWPSRRARTWRSRRCRFATSSSCWSSACWPRRPRRRAASSRRPTTLTWMTDVYGDRARPPPPRAHARAARLGAQPGRRRRRRGRGHARGAGDRGLGRGRGPAGRMDAHRRPHLRPPGPGSAGPGGDDRRGRARVPGRPGADRLRRAPVGRGARRRRALAGLVGSPPRGDSAGGAVRRRRPAGRRRRARRARRRPPLAPAAHVHPVRRVLAAPRRLAGRRARLGPPDHRAARARAAGPARRVPARGGADRGAVARQAAQVGARVGAGRGLAGARGARRPQRGSTARSSTPSAPTA